jgi:hypothetical protein
MIKTVYIAGPMTGYPEYNYPAFNEAEEILSQAGWEVINPAKTYLHSETSNYDYFYWITDGLRNMAATYENNPDNYHLLLLPGWPCSPGASIERTFYHCTNTPRNGKFPHGGEWYTLKSILRHSYECPICNPTNQQRTNNV